MLLNDAATYAAAIDSAMPKTVAARPVLGDVVLTRLNDLEEIRRILLAIIPRERARRGRLQKQ